MLTRIAAYKREETARRKQAVPESVLRTLTAERSPPRPFAATIERAINEAGLALIAEIKKASPSKGPIRADFDPAALARAYEDGGATCLSVLTDGPSFQGTAEHLAMAREACSLPALRKDFMLEAYQIWEARAIGADAVLVIMAAVDDATARDLVDVARGLGMAVLVEVHSPVEIERALKLSVTMIGINNRDLATFTTSIERTVELAPLIPAGYVVVSESGIQTPDQIARLRHAGASAFLVGESLMRQADVAKATLVLMGSR